MNDNTELTALRNRVEELEKLGPLITRLTTPLYKAAASMVLEHYKAELDQTWAEIRAILNGTGSI